DCTVREWSVETGELAFEPFRCRREVHCVHYSPSEDRIAAGADNIQIWNTKTGKGVYVRNSIGVSSLVWTADGTHIIGVGKDNITIWNSHNGQQLRTWKAHNNTYTVCTLSLSPTGSHLASSNWGEKLASVFDISTGEQVAAFKHSKTSSGIAYSPSGQFIATGCDDNKVYVWKAPHTKSRASSLSSFLDQPAIPLAGPSQNDQIDPFWDSQPNIHHPGTLRDQQPLLQPQRILNKAKDKFANFFARRPAVATQSSPVQETIEPVEVAAGRDRVFWIIILPIVWTPVKKLVYMLFFCRKPDEEDEELPVKTAADSSQAAADKVATSKQSDRPVTVDVAADAVPGPHSPPVPASNLAIRTQPDRTAAMSLSSTEGPGAPDSSLPESIEMVARGRSSIPSTIPTVPGHGSAQPTHSTDPLFPVVTPYEVSPSTVAVTSARLSVSSNGVHSSSMQPSSQHMELQPAITLSPEEMALVQEYRRLKDTSVAIRVVAEPLSGPAHDRESYVHPSTSPQTLCSSTPSTLSTPPAPPSSSQERPRMHAPAFPSLDVAPSSLSPSRHFNFLHHSTATSNVHSMHLIGSAHDPPADAPLGPATQLTMHRPANDEDID
ncbi:hypothetical protein PAXINDRAFT_169930, partial [Paxillus involutus ATCC 200175]